MLTISQAVQGYIYEITADGFSPYTIKYNSEFLRRLSAYLGDVEINNITSNEVRHYYNTMRGAGLSGSTISMHYRVHRKFFKWAAFNFDISNPIDQIPAPRAAHRAILPFTFDEQKTMVAKCGSNRNRALLLLLMDTGIRLGELMRLTVGDYQPDSGSIEIKPVGAGIKSRHRMVYLGVRARRVMWLYLAERGPLEPTAPLIATLQGDPLKKDAIKDIFNRLIKRSGVANIHAHRFRHTFAVEYLRADGDVFTLQILLGHSDLKMVKHYVTLASVDVAAAHQKHSPVDRRKL